MSRVITAQTRFHSEEISPGVRLERFHPGGRFGPNDEVRLATEGGQGWSEIVLLGGPSDPFTMMLPDIRLPANQFWPLHWHDCWTVVLVVEGTCLVGDWWMAPGDVFITMPELEYGPLVSGPEGVRLFEIFAQAHLAPGGYAPEYRDHPTLQGGQHVFRERSPLNRRNEGRQTLPLDGVEGVWKTRMTPGAAWDLGEAGDPDRGLMKDTRLEAGERILAHSYGDWHGLFVLDGAIRIGERVLGEDAYLLIEPNGAVDEIVAEPGGAQLLELSRTARGAERKLAAGA